MTEKTLAEPLVTNSKIENYRLRANSLLGLSRRQSNAADGKLLNCDDLAVPQWDIQNLEQASEELVGRASLRVKKLKSVFSHMGVLKWVKKWKNIRKAEMVNVELDNFFPKLKDTEDDIKIWLEALQMEKSLALITGDQLICKVQANIARFEARLNHFDDLENDCLQINYDVNQLASESLQALAFNEEVLTLSHCTPSKTLSRNKMSGNHTTKAHRHSPNVTCTPRQQCKSINGSINKCKNVDSPIKELPLTLTNLQLLNQHTQVSPQLQSQSPSPSKESMSLKSHTLISPTKTTASSSDEDSDGKCSIDSADDLEGVKDSASPPPSAITSAEAPEAFHQSIDPLEPAIWHNMHGRNLNCKIGIVPTYNLPRKLSGPKLLSISPSLTTNTTITNTATSAIISSVEEASLSLNISHDKVVMMDLMDETASAATKDTKSPQNDEAKRCVLFSDDNAFHHHNWANEKANSATNVAGVGDRNPSGFGGVVIASESVASTDSMTTSNSDKDSCASLEDIVVSPTSSKSLLNPDSVLCGDPHNSSHVASINLDSPSNMKSSLEPQRLLHLLLHENRENLTRQEEMDLQRYAHFLELKDIYQIQDDDYVELCARIHRCHEVRHEGNLIIRDIRLRKEFDKCILKKNKCMLNELNKVCSKSTGVANSEADFFCRLPTEIYAALDGGIEEDLVCNGQFVSSKRTKHKVNSSQNKSSSGANDFHNNNANDRSKKNKIRSLRRSFHLDSIQKLLPNLFWSPEKAPHQEVKRPVSASSTSGKSPKATMNGSLCKIRTRSGKNLFHFPAPIMEEGASITPKDDASSVGGVVVNSSFHDLPLLDSGDDVQVRRLDSNSNVSVSIDEHMKTSTLYKVSLECVDDLKVILAEMEKAENSLQIISTLLATTSHISNDLKEAECNLCK